jgi:hypothetical protein
MRLEIDHLPAPPPPTSATRIFAYRNVRYLLSKFKMSLRIYPFLFAATPAAARDVFQLTLRALPAAFLLEAAREARTTGFSR